MAERYRAKDAEVEAIQFNGLDDYREIVAWMKACGDTCALADEVRYTTPLMLMPTSLGMRAANPGDWIVRGADGGFYPVRGDIFEAVYGPVRP